MTNIKIGDCVEFIDIWDGNGTLNNALELLISGSVYNDGLFIDFTICDDVEYDILSTYVVITDIRR